MFTGYPDNALISDHPAGPALGLMDDWTLTSDSDFFVNKTRYDDDAGTGKAVYNRPSGDNGARTARRSTSADHVLFEDDGDVFYASFLIDPARTGGDMTFGLGLTRLDGGGAQNFSFGIVKGQYIVGNGGDDVNVGDGTVTADEQLILVRVEYGEADIGPDDAEVVTLWVDPVDESSTPVIDGVPTDILNRGGGRITDVSMRGDWMYGSPAFFDNLRVGSSFAAVAPIPGDTDRDCDVDFTDFNHLVDNYTGPLDPGTGDKLWEHGDFDGDEDVDFGDFNTLANYYTGPGDGCKGVPEPSALALLMIGAVAFTFGWHRRKRAA
jgi:hypothetical protein